MERQRKMEVEIDRKWKRRGGESGSEKGEKVEVDRGRMRKKSVGREEGERSDNRRKKRERRKKERKR